jgi:hypothetical protein
MKHKLINSLSFTLQNAYLTIGMCFYRLITAGETVE